MAAGTKIVYLVHTCQGRSWREEGQTPQMDAALTAAEKLFSTKKYTAVKVEKYFYDEKNNRSVVTTILEKQEAKKRPVVLLLLIMSVVLGIAMYFATGAVMRSMM